MEYRNRPGTMGEEIKYSMHWVTVPCMSHIISLCHAGESGHAGRAAGRRLLYSQGARSRHDADWGWTLPTFPLLSWRLFFPIITPSGAFSLIAFLFLLSFFPSSYLFILPSLSLFLSALHLPIQGQYDRRRKYGARRCSFHTEKRACRAVL